MRLNRARQPLDVLKDLNATAAEPSGGVTA